jgi:hypothetical protein
MLFSKLSTPARKLGWIAGFLGGDGCIHISDRGVRVTYVQAKKGLENIKFIQDIEGGTLFRIKADTRSVHRQDVFSLTFCGSDAVDHLTRVHPFIVTKRRQCDAALAFPRTDLRTISMRDRIPIKAERLALKKECARLKHEDEDVPSHLMTLDLIGGWMASEGCVKISAQGHASLFISQKYPNILHAIREYFKCGWVSGDRWSVTNRGDVEIVARQLLGVSGVKDKVLGIVVEYLALHAHHDVHGLGHVNVVDIDSRRRAISALNGGSKTLREVFEHTPRDPGALPRGVTIKSHMSHIVGYCYRDGRGTMHCFEATRHRTLEDAKQLAIGAQCAVSRAKARRKRDRIEDIVREKNLETL